MPIIFKGVTPCVLCGRPVEDMSQVRTFTAFLRPEHRFWKYSDAVVHLKCFERDPNSPEVEHIYKRFWDIFNSRPKHLTSITEMEAWGKEAFRELDQL